MQKVKITYNGRSLTIDKDDVMFWVELALDSGLPKGPLLIEAEKEEA